MTIIEDLSGTSESSFGIGVGGARVRSNAGTIEARNAANTALAPFRSASVAAGAATGSASISLVPATNNAGIEITGNTGLAYIDFSRTLADDYNARLILNSATEFQFLATGGLKYSFLAPIELQNTVSIKPSGGNGVVLAAGSQSADRTFTFPVVGGNREIVSHNTATPALANGMLLIGHTGAPGPFVKALPTGLDGTIVVTAGAGTLDFAVGGMLAEILTEHAAATDGQAIVKSGSGLAYATISGSGTQYLTNSSNRTFSVSDANSVIDCTGSGQVILTIPTNASAAIPVGSRIECQINSGRYELARQSTDVIINNRTLLPLEFVPIGTIVDLRKVDTNTWDYRIRSSEQYKQLMYFTHWLSESDSQFTFSANGSAATNTVVSTFTSSTQPGILRTKTGSTAGGRAYAGTSIQAVSGGTGGRWYTSHLIRLGNLSDSTDRFIQRIGFQGTTGSGDTAGAFWKHTDNLNSGLYQLVTHDGTNSTSFDTATAPSTTGWVELSVFYDFAGARVLFYLDRTLVHTATSNLVTNINTRFGAGVSMSKILGTGDRELYTDYSIICGGWSA